jgi:hypothetical protein
MARSLTPGDSMTTGRVKAALATGSSKEVRQSARQAGMDYLIAYKEGTKQIIPSSDF